MAKKVQLQTNGKEWRNGQYVDVEKRDIDPITSSSCVQIEGFRTLEEAVSDNKMLSQDLTYTKVMDKVGGDYHQNVLDGQYSKAILYGNTQVNLCEEDSSVALQIPTTFTSFNNGELQIKNKENQVVAPLIKGVTMVNLAQTNSSSVASGKGVPIQNVKGNTVYTLSFTFSTKNTNSGVVIECYDVNGEYLGNVMHKTGLGDVAKFTFTTHANATKIHICNNAAYGGETIQLDDIMVIEGDQTALDIPFFKGMKSVELARPLTNLFDNNTPTNHSWTGVTNVDGTVTATSQTSGTWTYARFNITFKPNTSYVVMWDSLTYTQTGNANQTIAICHGNDVIANIDNNFTNKRSIIFNTGDKNPSDINLRIHATTSNTETGTTTVTGLRVFEYDDYLRSVDLQSIGYFSGTKNVAVEPVKTCSKNLYPYGDINFTPTSTGWFDAKGYGNMYGDIAQKSKCRFLLKKGTYYLSMGEGTNISNVQLINDKEEMLPYTPLVLEQDTYLTIRVNASQSNVATTLTNIQIERGTTVTDYVAHDSRYYEHNGQDTIVLRSLPSGVCDTFNLQTGEYTRRIGEVIFDGSEEWNQNGNGSYGFFTTRQDSKPSSTIVCDKLKEITGWNNYSEKGIFRGTQAFGIVVTSNELTTCNVETFKTWLSQNPLTVQYELSTPITTIIPRIIKRNNNGAISTIDFGTYTNKESLVVPKNPSYLTINSMTSIKPVVEPITYIDFKTRLKTNTDYSVIIDKDSTSKTINLGGTSKTYTDKMLVRTPSIDLEQNLRISGSGSIQNIMVIEGDVLDKELPYFNGICNVKMPIIRNTGKNLFNFDEHKSNWWFQGWGTNEVIKGDDTGIPYSALIPISPLYYYKIQADNWNRRFLAFLDSNFNTISWEANVNITSLAPLNARYLLCYLNSEGISKEDNIMITATKDKNSNTTTYEPYRGNDICIAQGEIELSKDMIEQGGFSTGNGKYTTYETMKYDNTARLRSKDLIPVKPNTTYAFTHSFSKFAYNVYQWNGNKGFIDETSQYFASGQVETITTTADTQYIHFLMSKHDASQTITLAEYDWSQFHMYELDSTVQLRSLPNGVKDELNLLTGEYIQRVGEIVLDGSEEYTAFRGQGGLDYFRTSIPNIKTFQDQSSNPTIMVSDKINLVKYDDLYKSSLLSEEILGATTLSNTLKVQCIYIYYKNINNVDTFKQYLQQNPITVQYQLAEPIISYPRIVSNTQEREVGVKLPNGVCDTYNPSTGITVKRVGKAILDGSEDWKQGELTNDTHFEAWLPSSPLKDMKLTYEGYMEGFFTNMFKVDGWAIPHMPSIGLIDGRMSVKCGTTNDLGAVSIGILKSKLPTQNVDGFKAYLKSNPLTVYYELANPIVTTDIVLPNGVHDEYNPLTGVYTKRVGLTEFDGSDDERWEMHSTVELTNTAMFTVPSQYHNIPSCTGVCDKFAFKLNWTVDEEGCYLDANGNFCLRVAKSKLATVDLHGLKTYLSQNPIKVWYELATPITYQLTPYFGLPMPYAYKDGYLIMDSAYDGQTLPPEITYQLTVNRTGQITQNNIKLKEHTARLSNLEYILIEATLDSIFDREMQNFELELMNVELFNLDE